MFLGNQRRHQNVYIMALDLELGVTEELKNAEVRFHDLALLLSRPIHNDHSSLLTEHDLILVLVFLHLLD